MNSRRTLAAVLALTQLTTVLATGVFSWNGGGSFEIVPSASAEGFAGEDLGLDLYRKVDVGVGKLKTMMAEKRLPQATKKLNGAIGAICKDESGASVKCLNEGKPFTMAELNAIEAGQIGMIFPHVSPGVKMSADQMTLLSKTVGAYAGELKSEAAGQTQALGKMASTGLFSDGNLDNSSYDLIKDLENIHAVIFSKNVPYDGLVNDGAKSVMSFAQATGYPSSAVGGTYAAYDPMTINPPAYLGSFSGRLTSSGLANSAECADGTAVNGLDQALAFDIENQLSNGYNASTSGTPADLAKYSGSNLTPVAANRGSGRSENKTDKFPCMTFFCIRVDFVMYNMLLLGGGKTPTIEGVLDENFKIVQKFAGTSFIQAQHTNNFFELLLKNLKLPDLVHLGVVVQTLPPPILNLKGGDTPRGEPKVSSEEKEFKEITAGAFKDYGIRYDKQNVIDDNQSQMGIRNVE